MTKIKLICLALLSMFFAAPVGAQYLTPRHIYSYAKTRNYRALEYVQKYIDAEDYRGQTPTCMAATNNDWQVYKLLVQYGANPEPNCLTPKQLAQVRQNVYQQAHIQEAYNQPRYNPYYTEVS